MLDRSDIQKKHKCNTLSNLIKKPTLAGVSPLLERAQCH